MEQRSKPGADQCSLHFKHWRPLQVARVCAHCHGAAPAITFPPHYSSQVEQPSLLPPRVVQRALTVALSMSTFPPVEQRSVEPLVSNTSQYPAPVHFHCYHGYKICGVAMTTGFNCTVAMITGGNKHTGWGREAGSDSWKQYMRRSTW